MDSAREVVTMGNRMYRFYGASGMWYDYRLPSDISRIPAVAGNYMFATPQNSDWRILYVGESRNLQDRLINNSHEKMEDCILNAHPGRVCILYHANQWHDGERRYAEQDLIDAVRPPLNN